MQAPVLPQSVLPHPTQSQPSASFQPIPDPTTSPSISNHPPPQPPPSVPVSASAAGQPPIPTFPSINHPQTAGPGPSSYPSQQWYPQQNYYGGHPPRQPNNPGLPYPNGNYNPRSYPDQPYHHHQQQQQQQPYAPMYHQNPYGVPFPHVPVGAGGPGPATMQNGYGGYQGEGYHPMPYGGGYQPMLQSEGVQQYPSQPIGNDDIDGQPRQQPPPHQAYPSHEQHPPNHVNGQPPFPPSIQHQPFHPAYPPNHPYAYGVGVGFPHYPQQPVSYGFGAYGEGYPPPPAASTAPHPRSGQSKGLNPAAQGFTFQPSNRPHMPSFSSRNGESSAPSSAVMENRPVFPSIPIPEQATLPNGHAEPKQAWVPPVIADGEKLKSVLAEQKLPEESEPGGLGISEPNDAAETSHSSSTSDPSASASTPAMSSSPTTATTPISVQTPRAIDADNSFSSPKSGLAQMQPGTGWTFGGEGLAGLASPPSSASRSVSGPSTRSASGASTKRRTLNQPVQTGPLKLSASRPDTDGLSGNVYALSLGGLIPSGVNTERVEGGDQPARKSAKGKSKASGKRVLFAVGGDDVRTSRHPVKGMNDLVFGSAISADEPTIQSAPRSVSAQPRIAESADRPTTPEPKPVSRSEATTPQPRVKPINWAAAVRGSQGPSPAISTSPSRVPSPAKSTISLAAEDNEAGPSRLPVPAPAEKNGEPTTPRSTTTTLPPPPPSTGASKAPAPRPAFNYAAAAAAGAGLSPQEELAKLLSEGVKGKGKEGSITLPRGLINTGNMCFANTILQVLVYCQPFAELFEELGKRLKADLGRKTPLLEAMIVFLREFNSSTPIAGVPTTNGLPNGTTTPKGKGRDTRNEAFIPENVYDAMKENKRFDSMRRGHQEDAEEYLGFFLNTLHEELLYVLSRTQTKPAVKANGPTTNGDERQATRPVSPGAADDSGWLEVGKKQKTHVVRSTETRESAITLLFGGTLRSLLQTPGSKDSVTLEPYQPLQLDVQSPEVLDITDALKHISVPEIVPGVWSASKKANVDATKQVYVESFPPVLILHLKRFVYDASMRDVVKRSKPVAYGTELVIPPEVISPAKRGAAAVKYKLFGVVYHHGTSASGGHYTVSVLSHSPSPSSQAAAATSSSSSPLHAKHQNTGAWIHFDDETVSSVPTSEVVVSRSEAEGERAGLVGGREKCAYLLFYQRVR